MTPVQLRYHVRADDYRLSPHHEHLKHLLIVYSPLKACPTRLGCQKVALSMVVV